MQDKSGSSGLWVILLLFQVFVFGLWIGGPRVGKEDAAKYCSVNIQFSANVGHTHNCDFSEFLYAASDPSQVWGPEGKRQSRPGSPLLVWAATRPLVFLFDMVRDDTGQNVAFRDMEHGGEVAFSIPRNDVAATYIGFVLLNIVILIACFKLYMQLTGQGTEPAGRFKTAAALAGVTLLINNVTKQFFWSAHTQLFNLLVPLCALYFFVQMQKTDKPEQLFVRAAVTCGIGMLFYGNFVIAVTVAGLGYVWRRRHEMLRSLKPWLTGALCVAVFAVPYGLWYGFIVLRNGEFFNYDVTLFKGFIWLNEVYATQGWPVALGKLIAKFLHMFIGAMAQGWGYMVLLAGLVVCARRKGVDMCGGKALWIGGALYALMTAAFFAWYGLTVYRLSFSLVVPVLPLIGFYLWTLEINSAKPEVLKRGAVLVSALYLFFILLKFGPYS